MSVQFRFPDGSPRATPGKAGAVKPISNNDIGNSGIYIYDRWEVQIIDPSRFDGPNDPADGVAMGDAINTDPREANAPDNKKRLTPGNLYGVSTPNGEYKNWVKPGFVWNTLTVEFTPPVLEPVPADPTVPRQVLTAARIITRINDYVVFDGQIKQCNTPLSGTGSRGNAVSYKPLDSGLVLLQSHWGAQVEFQNVAITGVKTA